MFSATIHRRDFCRRDSYEYAASAIGLPAIYRTNRQQEIQQQFQHEAGDLVRRATRAASCVGGFNNKSSSSEEEEYSNYDTDNKVLQSTIEDFVEQQEMDGNFTLPLENSTIQEMIKMFMSCQECKEVCTRPKQLQCAHTICKKCAMSIRKRHVDPGQWVIRCKICSQLTTWYGNNLNGLQDNTTMQKMVNKRSTKQQLRHNNDVLNTQDGRIIMYGDQDLTINIVSSAKEKLEIQKALETAERKIELCQKQTKQVNDYEKSVNQAKTLIRRQIEQSVDLFVSAIRSQQAQLMDDVDTIFQKDIRPVDEAKEAIEMQMQSLKLVTQCCCVASKILQSGGAPLDLNNFKKMVWETMKKTKAGKLPTEVRRRYKSNIKFKSNEPNYEDLAEQIGQLINKKQPKIRREIEEKRQVQAFSPPSPSIQNHVIEPEPITVKEESDEEPIYDLPPNEMETHAQQEEILNEERLNAAENETVYDEIPFYADNPSPPPPINPPINAVPIPFPPDLSDLPPLPPPMKLFKPKTPANQQTPVDLPNLPPPPVPQNEVKNIGYNTLHNAIEIIGNRRRAIHGDSDDDPDSDDSFSSSGDEGQFQACPTPKERSRPGSTLARSVAGSHVSRRPSRSRPASPFENQEVHKNIERNTLPRSMGSVIGCERQRESNSGSSLVSKMLKRSRSFRSLVGSSNESTILPNIDSEKLLYCIGKAKKPGSASNNTQQFNGTPEISVGSDDTLWVADTSNHRIQLHEGGGGKLAGMFKTSIQGVLLKPKSVTAFKGGKKIAVSHGKYATVWTEGGELVRQIGPHSSFGKLGGMAIDSQGSLVLADTDNNSLVITSTNRIVPDVAIANSGTGKSQWPGRIAVNNIDQLVVPDYGMHDIKIFNYNGQLVTKFGSFGVDGGQFRYPSAVAVDSNNRIYVADECNNRVSLFSSDGEDFLGHVITKEDGLAFPHAIAVFSDGAIAVADDSKVVKVYRGVGATN